MLHCYFDSQSSCESCDDALRMACSSATLDDRKPSVGRCERVRLVRTRRGAFQLDGFVGGDHLRTLLMLGDEVRHGMSLSTVECCFWCLGGLGFGVLGVLMCTTFYFYSISTYSQPSRYVDANSLDLCMGRYRCLLLVLDSYENPILTVRQAASTVLYGRTETFSRDMLLFRLFFVCFSRWWGRAFFVNNGPKTLLQYLWPIWGWLLHDCTLEISVTIS